MNETRKKKLEITIETHSLTIIRIRCLHAEAFFCRDCRKNVQIFTPAQAALIFRVSPEILGGLLRAGLIHAAAENNLCAASLAAHFKQEIRFIED